MFGTNRFLIRVALGLGCLGPVLRPAQTWADPGASRGKVCERLLKAKYVVLDRAHVIWDDAKTEFWHKVRYVSPELGQWFDAFFEAKQLSTRYAASHDDRKWNDPVRMAHAINRSKWHVNALFSALMPVEYRRMHNRSSLRWEYWHVDKRREYLEDQLHMEGPVSPKIIGWSYDDATIVERLKKDFPEFEGDPDLRAVEILVSPVLLFKEGSRRPRVFRRFTLVVMRDHLIVAEYPTVEIESEP